MAEWDLMSLDDPPVGAANKTAKFKNIFLNGKSRVLASLYNIYRRCMWGWQINSLNNSLTFIQTQQNHQNLQCHLYQFTLFFNHNASHCFISQSHYFFFLYQFLNAQRYICWDIAIIVMTQPSTNFIIWIMEVRIQVMKSNFIILLTCLISWEIFNILYGLVTEKISHH